MGARYLALPQADAAALGHVLKAAVPQTGRGGG
jgi:hypothetical protein